MPATSKISHFLVVFAPNGFAVPTLVRAVPIGEEDDTSYRVNLMMNLASQSLMGSGVPIMRSEQAWNFWENFAMPAGFRIEAIEVASLPPAPEPMKLEAMGQIGLTEAQIKHLVNRFLGWHFPEDMSPDGGLYYERPAYISDEDAARHQMPTGTNLLNATEADAMVRYMLEGMPAPFPTADAGHA